MQTKLEGSMGNRGNKEVEGLKKSKFVFRHTFRGVVEYTIYFSVICGLYELVVYLVRILWSWIGRCGAWEVPVTTFVAVVLLETLYFISDSNEAWRRRVRRQEEEEERRVSSAEAELRYAQISDQLKIDLVPLRFRGEEGVEKEN